MAFRFRLQALLRLRQSVEHQQEILLQRANQEVLAVLRAMNEVDFRLAETRRNMMETLCSGVTAAEVQFFELCSGMLHLRRVELEQELKLRQAAREQQAERFQIARREREVIETLRQQQAQMYHQQENRQEQRRVDDLLLLRREFLRRR
jgi:flagellar export protein FliJ